MQVRASYNPPSFEIEVSNGVASLHFYENVVEVNEPDRDGTPGFHGWAFDKYTIARPYDAGLAARVGADAPGWLAMAKREVREADIRAVQQHRAALLSATDWTALDDVPLSPAQKQRYSEYRRALRNVDDHHPEEYPAYPYGITWPEEPVKEEV